MDSSSSSLIIGDYIGMESCVDLSQNAGDVFTQSNRCRRRRIRQPPSARTGVAGAEAAAVGWRRREFPPPIPSLARTENLPSHMPWVMRRYYTADGRLVIREEKVRHHEYFTAHRSNGRLTLRLVPIDDDAAWSPPSQLATAAAELEEEEEIDDLCPESADPLPSVESPPEGEASKSPETEAEASKSPETEAETPSLTEVRFTGGGGISIREPERESTAESEAFTVPGELGGGGKGAVAGSPPSGGKCSEYESMVPGGACIFRMPVLPLRPVHS